ncbi:hypothetical protein [Lacinutrix sp.]|uniref:OB-fold protein n=1 Tax=Lacinutrix sp. TaxID=1937692 RepID=UPI0025BD82FC|nr:hypothetical protein [Lacinutrix sp.]
MRNNTMKKKLQLIFVAIIIASFFAYNYIYQDHRNISNESAVFTTDSKSLSDEFKNNIQDSETKYLNKTIVIKGEVSEINTTDLTLNDLIFCSFSQSMSTGLLQLNKQITIKGRCIGYDDLLEQVKLDQCTLIN